MSERLELNKFLSKQLQNLKKDFSSTDSFMYENYYSFLDNESLKSIFAISHAKLNNLFEFMNEKKSPLGGHYNADLSRELLKLIKILHNLEGNLKDSSYAFKLEQYYNDPEDFPFINIIEDKPIFTMLQNIKLKVNSNTNTFTSKLIGKGFYATVYKFKDLNYNRYFALKRAHKNLTEKELERFKNEFLQLKKLNSPYVIEVYYYNASENEYVMEYANSTLDKYISENNNK